MRPDQPIEGPPRRRLAHRLPKSLRMHWKLVVAFVAFVTVMATVLGGTRIRPQITGDTSVIASEITENITGTVDLFDDSVTHELSLDITDAEYQDMITSFQKSGDKKWVTADLTIDGTFVDDVSIRLKGNSTLMAVRGKDAMPGGKDFRPPDGMELPEGFEFPDDMPSGGPMAGLGMSASAEDPTSLPLLISFDENVSGRAYQGMTELSVRPGTPVLNEALALSLTAETDQPTQRYGYVVYSINDSATTTRLLLEHPDDTYANSLFDSDGYLYKADASSRFEYAGDDQSAYADQFKQINAVGSGNLQPIINFLRWMDGADAAEFDAHLADWVDVESFARYVATQNLLVNGDDMAGPGQNYYLWYDLETEKLTVVSWDLNLAMHGGTTAGPHDSVSIGFGRRGGAGAPDTAAGDTPSTGLGDTPGVLPGGVPGGAPVNGAAGALEAPDGLPGGGAGAPGGDADAREPGPGGNGMPGGGAEGTPTGPDGPQGGDPAAENPDAGVDGAPGGGMRSRGGNALKSRFLASAAFTPVYEAAYWDLADRMYGSGLAVELLNRLAETVPVSDGLSEQTLNEKVAEMRTWIDQRATALADLRTA